MKNKLKDEWITYGIWSAVTLVVGLAGFLVYTYRDNFPGDYGDQAIFGQFGDFVGGTINPLLGFLTVLLLLVSIHFQMRELKATRKEMKKAAKASASSAEAANAQLQFYQHQEKLTRILKNLEANQTHLDKLLNFKFAPYLSQEEPASLNDLILGIDQVKREAVATYIYKYGVQTESPKENMVRIQKQLAMRYLDRYRLLTELVAIGEHYLALDFSHELCSQLVRLEIHNLFEQSSFEYLRLNLNTFANFKVAEEATGRAKTEVDKFPELMQKEMQEIVSLLDKP